jgi:hypothetical protein
MERLIGPRLFSVHRWLFVLALAYVVYLVSYFIASQRFNNEMELSALVPRPQYWTVSEDELGWLFQVVLIVSTALSFSFSLCLSKVALRIPWGTTFFGLLSLFILHIVLLLLWRPMVVAIQQLANDILNNTWLSIAHSSGHDTPSVSYWRSAWESILSAWKSILDVGDQSEPDLWRWYSLLEEPPFFRNSVGAVLNFYTGFLGLFANLFRLVLTAGFLVCIAYVKAARPFIIRVWSAIVRPEAALFAPPLIALGALVVFIEQFPSIAQAIVAAVR